MDTADWAAEEIDKVLIDAPMLQARIRELGAALSRDYAGRPLHLVGVLKGVTLFMADLLRSITIPISVDFMAISTFEDSAEGPGAVRILKDLEEDIAGREVLLVEDIIDTGLTLRYLLRVLSSREPASLRVCTLLNKPARRLVDIDLAYVGFDLADVFVVGYGLDYQQRYRNLPYIAVLKPEVYRVG